LKYILNEDFNTIEIKKIFKSNIHSLKLNIAKCSAALTSFKSKHKNKLKFVSTVSAVNKFVRLLNVIY